MTGDSSVSGKFVTSGVVGKGFECFIESVVILGGQIDRSTCSVDCDRDNLRFVGRNVDTVESDDLFHH